MDSSGSSLPPQLEPTAGSAAQSQPVPPVVPPPTYFAAPPPVSHPPRKSGGGSGWKWVAILGVIFLCLGLLAFGLVAMVKSALNFEPVTARHTGSHQLSEVVLEDNNSTDKIAVLDVQGVITSALVDGLDRSMVDLIEHQLERAAQDEVKAVILKVDSPGGEVLASDEIYRVIRQFQDDHGIPVIASMGTLAASGGYYISAPCRWIVANELTITGSIGVIFHSYNFRGLMNKVGVRPDVTKSGKLKDMLSGEKLPEEELPEERQILQGMIDESFAKFKQVIREGRGWATDKNREEKIKDGRKLAPNWTEFADGRILSGSQALELGLVDELGNFKAAVERAKSLAGIQSANLVTYQSPFRFPSFLRFLGEARSQAQPVKVDLGLPLTSTLPQGRFYFMSPVHMH
jgi:protease IV